MAYGIIEYDEIGRPVCEICGQAFHRVLRHVTQAHGMTAREYKTKFGFDLNKGICSKKSSLKTAEKAMKDENKIKALIEAGKKTRFKKGNQGLPKEKKQEQSRLRFEKTRKKLLEDVKEQQKIQEAKKLSKK